MTRQRLTVALFTTSGMRDHVFTWLKLAKAVAEEIVVLYHDTEDDDGTLNFFQEAKGRGHVAVVERLPVTDLARYGFASAKNLLMDMSSGEWILYLDSDEAVNPSSCIPLKTALGSQADEVGILTVDRWNINIWPKGSDGRYVQRANWEEAWYHLEQSQYSIEPQHKILRNGVKHAGIIHEEPGGMLFKKIPVILMHMCVNNDRHNCLKHRLYMWLIKECVEKPERRKGVNGHWYTTYYKKNQEYVDRMAKEFEEHDPRFCGSNNS